MNTAIDATELVTLLRTRGETICVAESLTGGGLAHVITAVAGASDVFRGGVIAYSSDVKRDVLKVSQELMDTHTVVSQEVAVAMAHGAKTLTGATWAIATTGVAGPGPNGGHRAGTVWIAIEGPSHHSTQLAIDGTREVVRNATIASAISTLTRILST